MSNSFITALTGGMTKAMENTPVGSKRSQKKKTLARSRFQYQLMGARSAVGASGTKIALSAELTSSFLEFLETDNTAARIQLVQDGVLNAIDQLITDRHQCAYFVDFQADLVTTTFAICLQTCVFYADPLQLMPAILDKKLSVLQFLPVRQTIRHFLSTCS